MNKTRSCTGRFCASIRLKCKNKFTIKKVIFSAIHELFPQVFRSRYLSLPPTRQDLTQGQWPQGRLKFFRADSIPYMAIKQSTKIHKSQSSLGAASREKSHESHFGHDQRLLTPTNTYHTTTFPSFPQWDKDCL